MSLKTSRWIGTAIYIATVVVALGVAWKLHTADLPVWRYVFVAVLLIHIALWCLRAYFTHVIKRWSTHTVSVGWAIFYGIGLTTSLVLIATPWWQFSAMWVFLAPGGLETWAMTPRTTTSASRDACQADHIV